MRQGWQPAPIIAELFQQPQVVNSQIIVKASFARGNNSKHQPIQSQGTGNQETLQLTASQSDPKDSRSFHPKRRSERTAIHRDLVVGQDRRFLPPAASAEEEGAGWQGNKLAKPDAQPDRAADQPPRRRDQLSHSNVLRASDLSLMLQRQPIAGLHSQRASVSVTHSIKPRAALD